MGRYIVASDHILVGAVFSLREEALGNTGRKRVIVSQGFLLEGYESKVTLEG